MACWGSECFRKFPILWRLFVLGSCAAVVGSNSTFCSAQHTVHCSVRERCLPLVCVRALLLLRLLPHMCMTGTVRAAAVAAMASSSQTRARARAVLSTTLNC